MDKLKLKMSLAAIGTGFMLSVVAINSNAQVVYPGFIGTGTWQNWSGAYWGAYFGAGSGRASTSFQRKDVLRTLSILSIGDDEFIEQASLDILQSSGKFHGDITGSKADLFVGYNFNPFCTNFLFGGQLEGTIFSDISLKTLGQDKGVFNDFLSFTLGTFSTLSASTTTINETARYLDELRSMFSFVIRAGYLITPSTLFYLLAGLTEGHFVQPAAVEVSGVGGISSVGGRRNQWELGYTFGAGLEYQLTCNWFIRAEYRHLHFDIGRSQFTNFSESTTTETTMLLINSTLNRHSDTDVNFNLGQIGLVYRF